MNNTFYRAVIGLPGRFPQETLTLTPNDVHSFLTSGLRVVRGLFTLSTPENPPEKPLELYEFESCPYCRKVREVLTELDLEYLSRPSAHGSHNRTRIEKIGGKQQFPFLVDPNTGTQLYESEDIIDYLCEEYGNGRWPMGRVASPVNTITAGVSALVRPKGSQVNEGLEKRDQPDELLELYNFENSPFCRKIREKLCELDLDYYVHNVGKQSPRRKELKKRGGKVQVPFLVDPNTETELYESYVILDYLDDRYG